MKASERGRFQDTVPDDDRTRGGTGGCGTVILRVREEEQGLMLLFR